MRRISILGIVLGGIVALFLTGLLNMGLGVYAVVKLGIVHQNSPQHAQAMVRDFLYTNPVMYFGGMAIGCACHVLGGWLSAFTAREAERLNGALSVLIVAGVHVWKATHHLDPNSAGLQVLYVAVLTAGAWAGGWLRAAQKARTASAELTRV
jgi:hypothetical protein